MADQSGESPDQIDKRSRAYRSEANNLHRVRESLSSITLAAIELRSSVQKYVDASKTGNREIVAAQEDHIRQIRDRFPGAWQSVKDSADEYRKASNDLFADQSKGLAAMEDRLGRVQSSMKDMLGMSEAQAKAGLAGMAGKGAFYAIEGDIGNLKEEMKMKQALKNEGLDTAKIDERIANRKLEIQEKINSAGQRGEGATMQMQARGRNASRGLSEMLERDSSAFGKLAARASTSSGVVGNAMRGIMRTEALASKGVNLGAKGAAIQGLSQVIGTLSKSIAPLSAVATGAGLFATAIINVFKGMATARSIATSQVRAMSTVMQADQVAMTGAFMGSAENIRQLAGVTGPASLAILKDFNQNIIPGATKTLYTFNTLDRSSGTINKWTAAIANAAVQGNVLGLSMEESMSMISKIGSAFGGTAGQAKEAFEAIAHGVQQSRINLKGFMGVVGDFGDIGRRFGTGGRSMIAEVGYIGSRATAAGMQSEERRKMAVGSVTGMANKMPMLLGIGTAAGIPNMIEEYVDAARAENSGARMLDLSRRAMGGFGAKRGMFGGMSPMEALKGEDKNKAWQASMMMGQLYNINPEALLDKKFAKSFEDMLSGPGMDSKQGRELRAQAAAKAGDNTQEGMLAMIDSKDKIAALLEVVENIFGLLGQYAAGGIGSVFGGVKYSKALKGDMAGMMPSKK